MQMYSGLDSAFPRHLSFENGGGSEFFQYIFVTKFFFFSFKMHFLVQSSTLLLGTAINAVFCPVLGPQSIW